MLLSTFQFDMARDGLEYGGAAPFIQRVLIAKHMGSGLAVFAVAFQVVTAVGGDVMHNAARFPATTREGN